MAQTNSAHEQLCARCGRCCYKKIIVGRSVLITPFPCEHLDTDTNLCTIYYRRHELNGLCLSIEEGMKLSAFPAGCPYVDAKAPPGYRPARDDWDWAAEWDGFDELADDLDVSAKVRAIVRKRGPYAPPMWVETNARRQREVARACSSCTSRDLVRAERMGCTQESGAQKPAPATCVQQQPGSTDVFAPRSRREHIRGTISQSGDPS
ncbi:MAG TPA: hypothetical protein VGP72_10725 [Planctomycetota bacterium]|jgi:hypothetical protein